MTIENKTKLLLMAMLMMWAGQGLFAQQSAMASLDHADSIPYSTSSPKKRTTRTRAYTEAHPLVYEDMWDLWPYAFLNENGEPDGFNVELIRMVLGELKIPYVIKLKEKQDAFEDLRDGKSDLILGLSAGYHDAYGLYSENPVTLFTQSVASPKDRPVEIKTFRDLSDHQVYVNDSSLCHHLMIDYGWGDNAIPYNAVRLALLKVSTENEGAVVWNTLSLKWLINKYHIENLEITPINMPHGEYKFMSNDPVLLAKLDSMYSALDSSDQLVDLRNKWFYPEHQETGIPSWVWYLAAGAGLLALILCIYVIVYYTQARRLTEYNSQRNKRLALILETSHVRVWTYQVATQLFEWHNENGQIAYTYTADEFAHRYRPEDFETLVQSMKQLSETEPPAKGQEEVNVKLELKARDQEDGDTEEKDFVIMLSVLHRNKAGKPTVILGTKRDVTERHRRERQSDEAQERHTAIFESTMQGHIRFTPDGIIANINRKACEMFGCRREEILAERPTYKDLLELPDVEIEQADGYTCTRTFNFENLSVAQRKVRACRRTKQLMCDIELKTFKDEDGNLAGMFALCNDITEKYERLNEVNQLSEKEQKAKDTLNTYFTKFDAILQDGKVRMANYSPDSHTLTIFRTINEVQHQLTQTRCMTLADESSQNKAMHILTDMDERLDKEMRFDIRTSISLHGNYPLHFRFSFIPLHDDDGQVNEYFGLCQDITQQKSIDQQLQEEAKKVQEVENTKTSFINNTVQEIRTPMTCIVEAAGQLSAQSDAGQNDAPNDIILENSTYLLHLIDNILYLSRLEARMIEIVKQPCDFVDTFNTYCVAERLNSDNVSFITESPYEQLVVNIDAKQMGNVIERVLENAIQHTRQGFIRARYDYIGRQLMISIEDTGDGIPKKELEQLNAQTTNDARTSSGLGIPICKELLAQMGGHLEINSEEGLGTTVWIILPCQATTIKRKKMI